VLLLLKMKTIKPKKIDEDLLEELLEEAATEEIIHCPICASALEPDTEKCDNCGWENILVLEGYV